MTEADPIQQVLALPNGARFYKCAFQVNSFEYLQKYNKVTSFRDEESYNNAIIQACKQQGIEVIAVTDHYHVRSAKGLWQTAKNAGLHVFPGFEAKTKEGVHLLCLFDASRAAEELERVIGNCGIRDLNALSPTEEHDVLECIERARNKCNAVCIAAHIASEGGLLKVLQGQARINTWRSPHLLACSLPGPVRDAPDDLRPILENKNQYYRRDRPIAIINAQDVCGPEDLAQPGTSCSIKMSEISVEGLRQAFLDPASRIRLASDLPPEEHIELVAMAWQGGFLDDQAVHFNENLNVLIGGRGAGKSTVIESLRYVLGLDPLGKDARKIHEGIVRQVLKSGTKISLLVRSHRPAERMYRIERTVPHPPVVRDMQGQILNLTAQDIIPRVEVYGQHEISELTRSPEKLTQLLERFVAGDQQLAHRKQEIRRELERSRMRIVEARNEIQGIEERLASLPAMEETLRRFQEAGLEDRLKEQSLLVREEGVLKILQQRVTPFREILEQLRRKLPIDRSFLSPEVLETLPGKDILTAASAVIERLSPELEAHRRSLLAEWEDTKAGEFRHLERAAKKITRQLSNRVRVQVSFEGNREAFLEFLRDHISGRLSETLDILRKLDSLSLKEFVDAIREGRDVLAQKFGIPASQADRIAQTSPETVMQIEELDLSSTTRIELNLVADGQSPIWTPLENLSTGQKATAVLLLLLLESDAPLVVDQPEDDLDNRFITEGIVPKLREEKRRRQFVFATHNANIPVLGDAELIVGLRPSGEAGQGHADIPAEYMGSIDARSVRELVGEILEGGKEAFEMRRLKYGF